MSTNALTPTQRAKSIINLDRCCSLTNKDYTKLAAFTFDICAELERVKKERDDYFETLKSTCEKIGYTEEVAKAGESSVGTKVSDGISKMFDDIKRQLEATVKGEHCTCSDPVNDGDCASCKVAKYDELKRQVEELNRVVCVHHNDAARTGMKCPVCLEADNFQLRAENAELQRVHKSDNDAMLAALICLREHNIEFGSKELIQRLDEIDQLRAEHTMLKVQNDSLDRELTRRDNENAKLRKDKERLDWLNEGRLHDLSDWMFLYSKGETIRQAIDQAMKGDGK